MNSCILMAEIIQQPQLRHTPDGLELAEMMVQFPSLRAEEAPATLRVIGWGTTAKEIHQNYHQGDRVLLEGRLGMNVIERDGFKEKRAELTVQRIYSLSTDFNTSSSPAVAQTPSDPMTSLQKNAPTYEEPLSTPTPAKTNLGVLTQQEQQQIADYGTDYDYSQSSSGKPDLQPDVDDIPF
jgi:single-stranded DNA-binding protein